MSDFRTEVNIPVTRDTRTFEQRRRDMLTNLERRTSNRLNERPGFLRSGMSDTTASPIPSDTMMGSSHFRSRDSWDEEVDQWINETRRHWKEQMSRMERDMFALEPVEDLEFGRWGPRSTLRDFDSAGHEDMVTKMERQMESLRQQMDSISPLGPPRLTTTGGGSTIQSSSSRITKSSTTSSSGDPRNAKTKSNVEESVHHSRNINGVKTETSSRSSVSTTSTGADAKTITQMDKPGALLTPANVNGEGMNFLKDAYELDEDGQVHFKVRFNAKDFAPEDIDVTTVENRLTVHAKKLIKSDGSESIKEFVRTIDLPNSIDHEHFRCNLTEDGVLILDAPVKAPEYDSIAFDRDHQLSIKPRSETQNVSTNSSSRTVKLVPLGIHEPTILKDANGQRKLHLEVPIDPIYNAEDLRVRLEATRIIVSGSTKSRGSSSTQEFTRSYEIPQAVDPFSVVSQLSNNTLLIEAPLR